MHKIHINLTLSLLMMVFFRSEVLAFDPNLNLAAYWDFDEGSGTVLHDRSGNGNDGTIYGATWQEGIQEKALLFDGIDDYVEIPNSSTLRLGLTDFTVNVWVYETARNASYQDAILTKRKTGSNQGWFLAIRGEKTSPNGNVGSAYYQVSGGVDPYIASSSKISLNSWHSISLIYEFASQNTHIYIDGEWDSSKQLPPPNPNTDSHLFIGNDTSLQPYCFHGIIDEIRIYRRALGNADIKTLYQQLHYNTIINIDATLYGDPGQGLNTLKVPLTQGYYISRFVNPSIDSRALYTAWSSNYDSGTWFSCYGIKIEPTVIIHGNHIPVNSPEEAFNIAEPKAIQFYVPEPTEAEFFVSDNYVPDNLGGVSLLLNETLAGDFDGNFVVDFRDFAILANTWAISDSESSFNWRCDTTFDDVVDANDLAVFTADWLKGISPY